MRRIKKFRRIIFMSCIFSCSIGICPAFANEFPSFKKYEKYSKFQGLRTGITEDREALVNKIEGYIENEQYTQAMLELNKLLSQSPDDPRIYIMSAKLLRKTYQLDEAEKMAKKTLEYDYKNSDAYLALGYIYFDRARFSTNSSNTVESPEVVHENLISAFDHFFMASQYAPDSPYPRIALAEAYYANHQKDRAKDEILKAKELAFSQPEAFYEVGQYYYKINDYDKAKKYIEKSISAGRNNNYRAYYFAGRIAEQNGKIKEAQQLYLQTLKLKPDMLAAQKHLDTLIKASYKGKMTENTSTKDLFATVDKDLTLVMKADYFLMLHEFTKARDIYIELLQKNPNNSKAVSGLAELYYSKWKEGFSISKNFVNDSIYIMKTKPTKKNKIALLKFNLINETKMPEKIRQELINLSISDTFEFDDLLNEARAEYLLGNYEECHNKLYKLLNMKLSNYEKFKLMKLLCFDNNYYEALIVIDDLKKTYYHNEEIEPVENRINIKIQVIDEKIAEALKYWKKENYNKALEVYREVINRFPTYKPSYLNYARALDQGGDYEKAYENLNIYYKLYRLYPDKEPEISEKKLKKLIQDTYAKIRKQMKEQAKN